MDPSRLQKIEQIFDAALDLDPAEQSAYLDRACGGDDELRREIVWLLEAARSGTWTFLGQPFAALTRSGPDFGRDGLELAPGTRIDRYEIVRELGHGGMGAVFLAEDSALRRQVAVKFLHTRSPDLTRRFMREAQTTARCEHENIVALYDVGEHDQRPYMVLQYVPGLTLRAWHNRQGDAAATADVQGQKSARGSGAPAVPVADAVDRMIQVARALVCAHDLGVVHRDLKPENILVADSGTVKVLDFGIAKAVAAVYGDESVLALAATAEAEAYGVGTAEGMILGTPAYMSPEQWHGQEIDHQSDVWAFGVVLYELLAGRHPLAPLSYSRLRQIADVDRPMPGLGDALRRSDGPASSGAGPGVDDLCRFVDRCLRKHKADRVADAAELLEALESLSNSSNVGSAVATATTTQGRRPDEADTATAPDHERSSARPRAGRLRWILAGAATLLVVLGGSLALWWPPLDIPAFSDASGVVVAGPWIAGDPEATARAELTAALVELGEPYVQSVDLSRLGPDDAALVAAAKAAGAALVVRIGDGPVARILAVPDARGDRLLGGVPPLPIATPETRAVLAPLLRVMAWTAAYAGATAPPGIELPALDSLDSIRLGPRLTVLTIYLADRVGRRDPTWTGQARLALAPIRDRCAGRDTDPDWLCPLADYVHFVVLDPDAPGADRYLEQVASRGPPELAEAAALEMLQRRCASDPAWVVAELDRRNGELGDDDCRRLSLAVPAQCLLLQPGAGAAGPFWLRVMAEPRLDAFDHCGDLAARVLAGRAYLHAGAARWQRAAELYHAAIERTAASSIYVLDWAAAVLMQHDAGAAPGSAGRPVADRIASMIDIAATPRALRIQGQFLLWLASGQPHHARGLCSMYRDAAARGVVMRDLGPLGGAVCADERAAPCQVYRALTHGKTDASADALCDAVEHR